MPCSARPDSSALERLDRASLEAQFQDLISALDAARQANDAQRCTLLDLQSHQVELEIQGRELRETQKALEISRNRYARLFDEAPVGYAVFDPRGRIRAVNLTAANLLGRSREALEGASFLDCIMDSESAELCDHLAEVFDESGVLPAPCDLAVHLIPPARAKVVRLCSIRRDSLTGPECMTVLLDVTAEQESERERQASERLRQAVLDALPSQIAVLDRGGRLIAVNRAWRELAEESGVSDALRDALGLDLLAASRPARVDLRQEVVATAGGLQQVLRGESDGFALEYACQLEHRKHWFMMRAIPLDGEQEGAVVAYLDITERKAAEEEARRAREVLAQVARLNAVGILASSLIHELLQPLSSASFFCSAATQLAQGPAADPGRLIEVIGRIGEQVRRAGDVMERLRAFLRGRKMHKVTVSLDQVIKRAFALVQWFAADHRVELRLDAPGQLPAILADAVQIEQVLVNLICNAVQAINASGAARREIALQVIIRSTEVEMVLRDSGPGLPPGRHEAVFDIFDSTNGASLGLGLAISRAIAEAHGGRLWAEAAPSEGAAFHLILPLGAAEED